MQWFQLWSYEFVWLMKTYIHNEKGSGAAGLGAARCAHSILCGQASSTKLILTVFFTRSSLEDHDQVATPSTWSWFYYLSYIICELLWTVHFFYHNGEIFDLVDHIFHSFKSYPKKYLLFIMENLYTNPWIYYYYYYYYYCYTSKHISTCGVEQFEFWREFCELFIEILPWIRWWQQQLLPRRYLRVFEGERRRRHHRLSSPHFSIHGNSLVDTVRSKKTTAKGPLF